MPTPMSFHRRHPGRGVAAGLVLLTCTAPGHAQPWDAAAEFSGTDNPNGPWSYARSTSLGGPIFLLPDHLPPAPGLLVWRRNLAFPQSFPAIVFNPTDQIVQWGDSTGSPVLPHHLVLHPGPQNSHAVLRWTSPVDGVYSVRAVFRGNSFDCGAVSSTADVHLLVNDAEVWSGTITGFGSTAETVHDLAVVAGDRIDAVVGNGPGDDIRCDHIDTRFVVACLHILIPPVPQATCPGGTLTLSVTAAGPSPLSYQWRREGEEIPGADGTTYTIDSAKLGDAGMYDVVVSNTCGAVISEPARVGVCRADLDCGGVVNSDDYFAFLEAYFGGDADFNGSGETDSDDYFAFLAAFFEGC